MTFCALNCLLQTYYSRLSKRKQITSCICLAWFGSADLGSDRLNLGGNRCAAVPCCAAQCRVCVVCLSYVCVSACACASCGCARLVRFGCVVCRCASCDAVRLPSACGGFGCAAAKSHESKIDDRPAPMKSIVTYNSFQPRINSGKNFLKILEKCGCVILLTDMRVVCDVLE